MTNIFKKEKFLNNIIENNYIDENNENKKILEGMIKNDPIFDLINRHKKRLEEIKEWQINFTNINGNKSEITINDNNNNNLHNKQMNNYEINIENNIQQAKDFLKINSLNNNQNSFENNNNDNSSIDININNKNNIKDNNKNKNISINKNNNDNNSDLKDNSFSTLKNDVDNDKNNRTIDKETMKTGLQFKKEIDLDDFNNFGKYDSIKANTFRNNSTRNSINNNLNYTYNIKILKL